MRLFYVAVVSLFLLSSNVIINAQTRNDSTNSVTKFMFNIHGLEPALNFQYGFSKSFSLMFQGGITGGALFSFNGAIPVINYFIAPKAIGQFRYYYNFNKRVRKGRVTSRNSANYVALHVQYIFRPIVKNFIQFYPGRFSAGPVWGLQRTSKKGFNFNFFVGPGVSVTEKINYTRRGGTVHNGNLIRFNITLGVTIGGTIFSTARLKKTQKLIDFAD